MHDTGAIRLRDTLLRRTAPPGTGPKHPTFGGRPSASATAFTHGSAIREIR